MPYTNKEKQRETQRNYKARIRQRDRQAEGIDNKKSIPTDEIKSIPGVCLTGLSNMITDPDKKRKLDRIIESFRVSNNPSYAQMVRLGVYGATLYEVGQLYK